MTILSILNLTQHQASPEQIAAGVVDLSPELRAKVSQLLTFDEIPTADEMIRRARLLAGIIEGYSLKVQDVEAVMIGGAPFFMATLEGELKSKGIKPLYAFSRRESIDEVQPDGKVIKKAVFRHLGFVEGTIGRRE